MRDASIARYEDALSLVGFEKPLTIGPPQSHQQPVEEASEADGRDSTIETMALQVRGDELPPKIGDYEIIEVLGRGGFGVVYKARDVVSTALSR